MKGMPRRIAAAVFLLVLVDVAAADVQRYLRFSVDDEVHYGRLENQVIHTLTAAPWAGGVPTGETVNLAQATLHAPAEPSKVFAVGYNYLSHRGDRELPAHPPIFLKLPTSIADPGASIVYPDDATDLHYEAELVVVIGKTARNVEVENASSYVFGITAGNDVSERQWQANDLQWFRAKASDGFGPLGPVIVTGLDYNDVLVQSRLNGETMQSQRTRDFIHNVEEIISHISRSATLVPGDVIFTGTPGTTSAMQPGDIIEVEVEGVGVLKNQVVESSPDS